VEVVDVVDVGVSILLSIKNESNLSSLSSSKSK